MRRTATSNIFFVVSVNVCGSSEWNLLQDFLLAPELAATFFEDLCTLFMANKFVNTVLLRW